MMKDNYLKIVDNFKLNDNTKKLLRKQIELFYEYNGNKNKTNFNNDEVVLSQNNLIHGTRANFKTLEIISIEIFFKKAIDTVSAMVYNNYTDTVSIHI